MDKNDLSFTGVPDLPNETGQTLRCLRTLQQLDASLEIRPHQNKRHVLYFSLFSNVEGGLRQVMDVQPNTHAQDSFWAYLTEKRDEQVEVHGQEGFADAVRRFLRQTQ
jgi:hypothetical protein